MTTRRSFFAAISAALSWRPGKSNIGLAEFRTQDSIFEKNPLIVRVALPKKYTVAMRGIKTAHNVQEAVDLFTLGKSAPDIIAVGGNSWCWMVGALHPLSRNWVNPESELHLGGFQTMACFGAEMVLDPALPVDDIWLINSRQPEVERLNAKLVFLNSEEFEDAYHEAMYGCAVGTGYRSADIKDYSYAAD